MPLSFWLFLGALLLLAVSAADLKGKDTSNPTRAEKVSITLGTLGLLLLAGVVLHLMWDAWSPWAIDLGVERR